MKIACLAWGSLIWDPRELPYRPPWYNDGPMAPIEFSRQSYDGRITLVLDPTAAPVRLYWAEMQGGDLDEARQALRQRERIPPEGPDEWIGAWRTGEPAPALIEGLPGWAGKRGFDAAIWANLPSQYTRDGDSTPTSGRAPLDWVLTYLASLSGPLRDTAERYIRRAPPQTDTAYRRRIAETFGWTPL